MVLASGDGQNAVKLLQRNPRMRLVCVEPECEPREAAQALGLAVFEDAAGALGYLAQTQSRPDAWIVGRTAWRDETFTAACRKRLLELLQPNATVVWEVASQQYWQYILRLISGTPFNEHRASVRDIAQELQRSGVGDIETVEKQIGSADEFQRYRDLLSPVAAAMKLPENDWQQRLQVDAVVLRGRYQARQTEPMAIHAVLGETKVCARVRVDEPYSFLATLPKVSYARCENLHEARFPATGRLVWIWQRLLFSKDRMIGLQKDLLERHAALTIQEWDDDPLHWEEHFQQSQFIEFLSAHAIQTSTPALADYFRQFNPEVRIFPNCIAALPPLRLETKPVSTVFFGALNRKADWEPILPAFNRVLAAYRGRVRVLVVLDREFFDAVEYPEKRFVPFCPYPQYQDWLRQSDVALLPLLPTRFNRMKSDLKFIECAAGGAVALANPTVYADTIEHGKTGWLYETTEQFEQGLARLLEDQSLRHQLAKNAWQWVRENRLLSQHYRERLDWVESLFGRYDELTAAIGERVPELRHIIAGAAKR